MVKNLISFVVPVLNEEESLEELYSRIAAEVELLEYDFELIFIDDGSADSSWSVISQIAEKSNGKVQAIKFRKNFGKARALATGFEQARGEIVFTLDADLQDDPQEIPRFIEKLNQGYDVVSGWKKVRHDPWHKVLPSRVFNKMLSTLVGVHLHDHNCGFKCYRAEVVKDLSLYGEMHRMVPSLASIKGYRSTEVVVQHHARKFGQSKYGVKRFLRGFMDMITVSFLKNYQERPLHLMGGIAVSSGVTGLVIYLVGTALSNYLPAISSLLVGLSGALLSAALPLFAIGLLSELVISRRTEEDQETPTTEVLGTGSFVKSADVVYLYPEKAQEKLSAENVSIEAKALVVDDDPRIRRLLEFQLNELGFQVEQAKNGQEAVDMIDEETSVVLLDLMMPEKDGLQCLKEFRNINASAQVIMVSAHGQIDKAVQAMKNGAFDYLQKPFSPEELEQVILQALKAQQLESEYRALRG